MLWVVAFVVASTFLKHAFLLVSTLLVAWVATNITRDIRLKVFDKALAVDRAQFMRHGSAGFMAQVTGTSEMLASGITSVFGGAVTEPLKIFACLAGAFCISWQLTLACLTLAPAVGFMMVWLNRRIRAISRNILTKSLGFHHVLLEAFNNVQQAFTRLPLSLVHKAQTPSLFQYTRRARMSPMAPSRRRLTVSMYRGS